MDFLGQVLPFQADNLKITIYKDELETMRYVFNMPADVRNLSGKWLAQLHADNQLKNSTDSISNELRNKGNEALKLKQSLQAAAHYTAAIAAATAQSETLALAHANRAQALLDFGYYAQAYDDCVCALNSGYPQRLRHKVILRQASCAAHLENVKLLQQHLKELQEMPLNELCNSEVERLQAKLTKLLASEQTEVKTVETAVVNKTKIAQGTNGRCLKACSKLEKDEVIFSEIAYSLVAAGETSKCEHCLATLFIPFACINCRMVYYCSLKCQAQDASNHKFECAGFRMNLFANVGIAHLALRTVLHGLPQILELLKAETDASSIWQKLLSIDDKNVQYVQTLQLLNKLESKAKADLKHYALVADTLLQYLRDYTEFFNEICSNVTAANVDWELVIAALLLRHIGQFIINAHEVMTLQATPSIDLNGVEGNLLRHEIWNSALHLKRGRLHEFNAFGVVAAANFPYLSMANHACAPSFQTMFNKRSVRTLALKEINNGDELFNCYTLSYRFASKMERIDALKEYKFQCECEKCLQQNADADFELSHRYRCEQCNGLFVPQTFSLSTLFDPVQDVDRLNCKQLTNKAVVCSLCEKVQSLNWYRQILKLLNEISTADMRKTLFKNYKKLEHWLPEQNELKTKIAYIILENTFELMRMGVFLDAEEYNLLGTIVDKYLQDIAEKNGEYCMEYASQITYLWDLVALGKYKCKQSQLSNMLRACNVLSDEFRTIFQNYYEDYVKSE